MQVSVNDDDVYVVLFPSGAYHHTILTDGGVLWDGLTSWPWNMGSDEL